MRSLRKIELFFGHWTHENSISKVLPMIKWAKAEPYFTIIQNEYTSEQIIHA